MRTVDRVTKELAKGTCNSKKAISEMNVFADKSYKDLAPTKKDAIETIYFLNDEIEKIQMKREAKKNNFKDRHCSWVITSTLSERFWGKWRKAWESKIHDITKHSVNGGIVVKISENDKFCYRVEEYLDWDGYSKRTKYPKKIYTHKYYIPWSARPWDIAKAHFDGLYNLRCTEKRNIGSITIYSVTYIKERKGYDKDLISAVVASNGTYHYHADSEKEAIAGLRKKLKRNQRRYDISLDSYLSKKKYHEITGACYQGIEAWCGKHGINPNARMKVREILPILEQERPYGADKILSILE